MAITGKVKTIFEDESCAEAIFPRTKLSAVSNNDGVGLDALLVDAICVGEDLTNTQTVPYDADTLQGYSLASLMLRLYPVGSIYLSVNSTSPATLFGGTWERIQDRFLLASGSTYSAGSTGGEASHTLTVNEMPSHNHLMYFKDNGYSQSTSKDFYLTDGWGPNWRAGGYTMDSGGNQPHNNMPPYLAVHVWKRTA